MRDYNEVKAMGSLTDSTRTPAQTEIAYFWTDNPILMWQRALRTTALQRIPSLGNKARLFALANLAAADCGHHGLGQQAGLQPLAPADGYPEGTTGTRPRNRIRNGSHSSTRRTIRTIPSGANGLSGAFTKSLQLFFGRDDLAFVITSNAAAAITKSRTYASFSSAAKQVVNVRIWQGLHFRFADEASRKQGEDIAKFVHDHYLLPL